MQPLPPDFLTKIAREYALSQEQEEAFVALYSSSRSDFEVAEQLCITETALRTRMTGFYSKFSIGGKGPGKRRRLHDFLLKQSQPLDAESKQSRSLADVSELVQRCRSKIEPFIRERCGTMRVLDMEQPIGLGEIYTSVNILEKLTGRRRLELSDLLEGFDPTDFDRVGLGCITEKRVPGLDAVQRYQKLMVLGKPGAGKTTFLKYLAIECCGGNFLADHIPVFVPLKEFAETKGQPELRSFAAAMLEDVSLDDLCTVLQQGKMFFLLDGLDEVREEDAKRVIRDVQGVADKYPENQFVITCRIAARDYIFQQFTEVEVADFDEQQIAEFADKWFCHKHPRRAEKFLTRLQENNRIQELATSPLLLTLLCLVFEERGKFKDSRAELYEEGIELLLERWDDSREIEREQVYRRLPPKRKEDLLSHIALPTFENSEYFFKRRRVEQLISTYIRNLPDVQADPDGLLVSSGKVLKSIEAQHGLLIERARDIYSFSHLTFQEYFAARQVMVSPDPRTMEQLLQDLVIHLPEQRWREVFLLTVEMLPDASYLLQLMKQRTDQLVADEPLVQEFLAWCLTKSLAVTVSYKPNAVRSFYMHLGLDLAFAHTRNHTRDRDHDRDHAFVSDRALFLTFALDLHLDRTRVRARDYTLTFALFLALALARTLDLDLDLALDLTPDPDFDFTFAYALDRDLDRALDHALDLACRCEPNSELTQALSQLKSELPACKSNGKGAQKWWQAKGLVWGERLRAVMLEHRNIGHEWRFSKKQVELLRCYLEANLRLVECLKSAGYVSREVREEIENTLLLPKVEIERYKREQTLQ
ncbi:MAG TPA: NACHT domain-containing NTPase [Leptolyngbyaceae cyanobacterium]